MFAFEPGGIPTVSMIGNDPKNLSWQNTHKSGTFGRCSNVFHELDCASTGSTLMLTVADSNQNIGGIASILYNVTSAYLSLTCISIAI